MRALRFGLAFAAAGLVTLALFFLMQRLVAVEEGWSEPEQGPAIELVRLERESELARKRRKLPSPVPEEPPPPPAPELPPARRPDAGSLEMLAVGGLGVDLAGGPNLGAPPGDTDIVPLVRVMPEHPPRARLRGIEGWVLVEFTITAAGTVRDARVLEADPPRVFDRAALRAIRRWKYNPMVRDGKPMERPGVTVRLEFALEDEES